MKKINEVKWRGLQSFDDILNNEVGPENSPEREAFEARAKAYYYAELLKEQRKQQKMTQQQLADKIGKKREYISTETTMDTVNTTYIRTPSTGVTSMLP